MGSKYPTFADKDFKITWYEPIPGIADSGGLGMRFTRAKKTRSFFGLITPSQVAVLYAFIGEQLRKSNEKGGRKYDPKKA